MTELLELLADEQVSFASGGNNEVWDEPVTQEWSDYAKCLGFVAKRVIYNLVILWWQLQHLTGRLRLPG
jgi:hypothetical protein